MNILILGSGIVGANLANKLSEQGKDVFLLDDDANELKRLSERYDIKTICCKGVPRRVPSCSLRRQAAHKARRGTHRRPPLPR